MLKLFLRHIFHSKHLLDHRLEVKCPSSQAVLYHKDKNLSSLFFCLPSTQPRQKLLDIKKESMRMRRLEHLILGGKAYSHP